MENLCRLHLLHTSIYSHIPKETLSIVNRRVRYANIEMYTFDYDLKDSFTLGVVAFRENRVRKLWRNRQVQDHRDPIFLHS